MELILERVNAKEGAPMGRQNKLPPDPSAPIKLRLHRLTMVDGDYDEGGAYWGRGTCPVRVAYGPGTLLFVRERTRYEAKTAVLRLVPKARFYR